MHISAFFLTVLLSFCDGETNTRVVGCEKRTPPDYSKILVLRRWEDKEELCLQCEAIMETYRCRGFDFVHQELQRMCQNNQSRYSPDTCLAHLAAYKETARRVLWQLKVTDPEACRFALRCGEYNSSVLAWKLDLPTDPISEPTPNELRNFSVLHLTDTHVSTDYEVGSSFDCVDDLCCTRRVHGIATRATAVGPYGDIRGKSLCDIPTRTLRSLLADARHRTFSHVYLTGDFIPHEFYNFSSERVLVEIAQQTEIISKSLENFEIFPSVGNHDIWPLSQFPTHGVRAGNNSIDKFYADLWKIWGKKWIPEDAKTTFLKGGYYSARARNGIRVLSMNSMYCDVYNMWLAVDAQDPEDQLAWLVSSLEKAADDKEKVHILGHISPGMSECRAEWAAAYQRIIARFRDVIEGQFFGHLHWDTFTVDYVPGTDEPTGVQVIAPSATTFMTGYPTYRIMHFGTQAELLDMDTYFLNTTAANARLIQEAGDDILRPEAVKTLVDGLDAAGSPNPEWQLAYRFKSFYNMTDLTPKSFNDLIGRLREDDNLLAQFYRAYFQHRHDPAEVKCHKGSCNGIFYYSAGSKHDVTCELYSQGSDKWTNCFKEMTKRNETPANATMLLLAFGGVIFALLALTALLYSNEEFRKWLYRVAKNGD